VSYEEIEEEDWRGLLALLMTGGFVAIIIVCLYLISLGKIDLAVLSTLLATLIKPVSDIIGSYFKSKENRK